MICSILCQDCHVRLGDYGCAKCASRWTKKCDCIIHNAHADNLHWMFGLASIIITLTLKLEILGEYRNNTIVSAYYFTIIFPTYLCQHAHSIENCGLLNHSLRKSNKLNNIELKFGAANCCYSPCNDFLCHTGTYCLQKQLSMAIKRHERLI